MADKHTICLLNDSFPPVIDGVANAVVNYAGHIQSEHGRAVVVTPDYPGADDRAFSFPVLRYPSIDTRSKLGYVTGYPFSPDTAMRLKEAGTELLHSHCPIMSTYLARELRWQLDAPLVFTYHTKFDIDIARAVRGKLLQESAIKAIVDNISACDEVWVVSRGAGENLRSLGYDGDYIVMENGVDMPKGRVSQAVMDKAAEGVDLPENVPVFLFVGRMMWYKGLRLILDALCELKEQGLDFRMVFVGGGADSEAVRSCAGELGLDGKCFFAGAVRDRELLRGWYSRADLFLFPSTFDTNGLVVREAAAACLASVLVKGSCAAEGVTDGKNGFLIEETPASLAACLKKLCADPQIMARVGEQAGDELYISWKSAVDKAYDRYGTVLDLYRSGAYKKRRSTLDSFLKSQGELMEAFGKLMEKSGELETRFTAFSEELGNQVRDKLHGTRSSSNDSDRYL